MEPYFPIICKILRYGPTSVAVNFNVGSQSYFILPIQMSAKLSILNPPHQIICSLQTLFYAKNNRKSYIIKAIKFTECAFQFATKNFATKVHKLRQKMHKNAKKRSIKMHIAELIVFAFSDNLSAENSNCLRILESSFYECSFHCLQ